MLSGRTRAGRGTQWCVRVCASSCGPGYGPPASIWHLIDTLQLEVDLLVAANISWALKLVEDGLLPLPSTQDDDALSPCDQLRKAPLAIGAASGICTELFWFLHSCPRIGESR